jgi:hypothetical protein
LLQALWLFTKNSGKMFITSYHLNHFLPLKKLWENKHNIKFIAGCGQTHL